MSKTFRLHPSDLIGFSRLASGAVTGLSEVVEAVHVEVAQKFGSLGPSSASGVASGITALVYNSIRRVTRLVDSGLTVPVPLTLTKGKLSPGREAVVAAMNGILGDYLVRTNNPLAISMSLRCRGRSLEIESQALQASLPSLTGKVLLLVHGLCLNDLQWKRKGHNHGAALARDLNYTPMYLQYNSGLHVSENGQLLAGLIETLLEHWPVPVEELAIIGHSMGGLVSRSAFFYGTEAGHHWPRYLRRLIFLGTPHHGAPLERLGNWVDTSLEISPYTVPFARIGKIRSAGITDMRYGNLLEDDWRGRDRFALSEDVRHPVPLPPGVESYAIAATRHRSSESSGLDLLGDGLVAVDSALGCHPNPEMSLEFGDSNKWIGYGMNHWDLLSHPAVYDHVRVWLS
jgi:pimeloyl-ACP methyl ester carboxylesterase